MMYIGASKVVFRASYLHSLKEKRSLVAKMKTKAEKLNRISCAEVSNQDTHELIGLGFALVSNDKDLARRILEKMTEELLDDFDVVLVHESLTVNPYEEEEYDF